MNIHLHQITHWQDPILPEVLDLYQVSFPTNEQNRLSWWVRLLNELSLNKEPASIERLLCAVLNESDPSDVLGFVYCEVQIAQGVAYLMYLATREDLRGHGIGAQVYQYLIKTLNMKKAQIVVFEVEKPSVVAKESAEKGSLAQRRIAWYERQGALLLEGIHYIQSVGWQPAVEMHLMFHSPESLSSEQALTAATALFGDSVKQIGELSWRPTSARIR